MKLLQLIKNQETFDAKKRRALALFNKVKDKMVPRHREMWNDYFEMFEQAEREGRDESAAMYLDRLFDVLDRYGHI